MVEFRYTDLLPLKEDTTPWRLLATDPLSTTTFEGKTILKLSSDGLTQLAETAFTDVAHLYRPGHLKQWEAILGDPESSPNDRYVALEMLKNAVISAEMEFPMCQDTGTAIVMGKKGQQVWTTGEHDEEALSRGIFNAYTKRNLRYSQNAPLTLYQEKNTGCNLPAQIEIYATPGAAYKFLFIAKGGGSANKTFLFQETRATLNPGILADFLVSKMKTLGTAACPPYHLAVVIGGTSAEFNLKTVKLASAGYLDALPVTGSEAGHGFRDLEMEQILLDRSRALGLGAQFGGKYFCLDVRVIRLPRHGASCPIGMGVSCSADRNIKAKITSEGIFLEQLETDPAKYLPQPEAPETEAVAIDLNQPMEAIRRTLSKYPVATRLKLSGNIVVARDIAHARLKEQLDKGEGLPPYFRDHIIYYAGPAKTPPGYPSGSFGPTTAGRMDPYVPLFQAQGASMVMLAKGNRSRMVTDACKKYGGFYLGSIGGPAARLGRDCITAVDVIDYADLGMEAIHLITVKDFPAFILVDDKGNDFFEKLT
ncbi:fumarate hydratase [Desulfosarcina sp. OttesenSCG-928-A07]|nr:fumarate hydratase [Desulfosarcina sp. OttesenSCG-928-G17]MDL2328919.1 fumarate hydratase [Desulfosarcina sp. OttesenSCG-928-A07]